MTSQYGAYAWHAGLARLNALMRMHTPTRPRPHMHAHTDKKYSCCFSTATVIRESASKLRYTCIAPLVDNSAFSNLKYTGSFGLFLTPIRKIID